MPAKPSYCHRLTEGILALEGLSTDWVDRRQLEEALGISKTVAWRVLRRCGARQGPGNTIVCRRTELIEGLKRLEQDGGKFEYEIRRRNRLEDYLNRMRAYLAASREKVAPDSEALSLRNTRFSSLPSSVTLTPRSLHIDFSSPEDFLKAFGAVVFALSNDYEAVRDFIEADKTHG